MAFVIGAICLSDARAQVISADVEARLVSGVGAAWRTVPLNNSYSSPVVACTYVLPSAASNDATVRVRNAGASSFDVRVQQFETSNAVTTSDVHCLIVDEGAHTLADGRRIEARRVLSDGTNGDAPGWGSGLMENVTATFTHPFSNLVVLGQVMTFNDARASVFWSNNCSNRGQPATPASFCVGKHIGMINGTRADETLGVIAVEAGTGTVNGVGYAFARGPNSIRGVGDAPPYTYSVSGDFDVVVATKAAENGGNGGWAVLFGADPAPANQIRLAIDEEVVAGDRTRRHIDEEVYYAAFENNQTVSLSVDKSVAVFSGSGTGYMTPQSDVIYTIDVQNLGTASVDADSVFIVDNLPAEVSFYNGDIDDGGPETGAIAFAPMGSGLTFDAASDVGFSSSATAPATFAACTYAPGLGYDPNVRHVCFNPKGGFAGGGDFEIRFRARIE